MNYIRSEQITVRLAGGQKEWLYQQANKRLSNISVLVRQAVKLLQEKYERERKGEGNEL